VIGVRAVSAAFSEPPGEGIADLEGVIITGHARGNRTDTPATDYAKQAFARLPERSPETGLICLSGPSGPMVQAFDTAWRRAPDGRLTGPDFPTRARRIHPFTLLRALGNGVCAGLSMGFGLRGPALNVLDGTVTGQNMQRHRHQEFIRFLNALERDIPAGKVVHVILDNYAAHKHAKVRAWLERHPRWTFHFTPTSAPSPRTGGATAPAAKTNWSRIDSL